jgi:hypothetical protein
MKLCKVLIGFGFVFLCLAVPAVADQPVAAVAQPAAVSEAPEFLVPSKKRLGYCHCGCSTERVCRTSADCGGASCDQFISCC